MKNWDENNNKTLRDGIWIDLTGDADIINPPLIFTSKVSAA
jgi:hypothetical protein